jgi:hypothetical protein
MCCNVSRLVVKLKGANFRDGICTRALPAVQPGAV